MRTMRGWSRPSLGWTATILAAAAAAGTGPACGGGGSTGGGDTLPAEWAGALPVPIGQTSCKSSASPPPPSLEVTRSGDSISVALSDVDFRCNQLLCGFIMDSGATTRLLVQPCDLHPTLVAKCGCPYDVTLSLTERADREVVEAYRRVDFYGATSPPQPVLVASGAVPTAAPSWYRTCGDPVCAVGDGGMGSTDGGVAACTTETAGAACTTSGATCDPGDGCNVLLQCTYGDPRAQPGGCPI